VTGSIKQIATEYPLNTSILYEVFYEVSYEVSYEILYEEHEIPHRICHAIAHEAPYGVSISPSGMEQIYKT
jgi:hypothetical protein